MNNNIITAMVIASLGGLTISRTGSIEGEVILHKPGLPNSRDPDIRQHHKEVKRRKQQRKKKRGF